MQDISLDADEQALIKKPRPFGWFAFGLVTLGALGFLLASHLPLSQAHTALLSAHEKLAKKTAELDHGLRQTRAELEKVETDRREARGRMGELDQASAADKGLFERLAGAASSSLDKFVKAKLVVIESSAERFAASWDVAKLFTGPTAKLAPAYGKPLCTTVESLTRPGDLGVWVSVPVAEPGDGKAWELAGERAAAVGTLLVTQCKLAPERVSAAASGTAAGTSARLTFVVKHQKP